MAIQINKLVCGLLNTNTYIISNGNNLIIIDPACKLDKLYPFLENKKLSAILLTHGHFDHIKTVDDLHLKYDAPIYIHRHDEYLIRDKNQGKEFGQSGIYVSSPCFFLNEGMLKIDNFDIEVIFTSGHTKGSVCYRIENALFTGDTLFRLSIGRTDLDGGSASHMKKSLLKLKEINENLDVFPGHDEISSLDFEKNNNIFMKN